VLAATCFGSSLPSSGSLLDPPELREIKTCGYVACVPVCRGSVSHNHTLYVNKEDLISSLMMAGYCRNM
jgi:hypothetical protein